MGFLVAGMVIVSMLPWVLAAASWFLIESGAEADKGEPVSASYQPMLILTGHAADAA